MGREIGVRDREEDRGGERDWGRDREEDRGGERDWGRDREEDRGGERDCWRGRQRGEIEVGSGWERDEDETEVGRETNEKKISRSENEWK